MVSLPQVAANFLFQHLPNFSPYAGRIRHPLLRPLSDTVADELSRPRYEVTDRNSGLEHAPLPSPPLFPSDRDDVIVAPSHVASQFTLHHASLSLCTRTLIRERQTQLDMMSLDRHASISRGVQSWELQGLFITPKGHSRRVELLFHSDQDMSGFTMLIPGNIRQSNARSPNRESESKFRFPRAGEVAI